MANDMIFWDDMWNQTNTDKPNTESTDSCCGDWDENGVCQCNNKLSK